jgi:glycerol uptake operon antiterminator
MKHSEIIRRFEENPIIAAVRDEKDLGEAIASQVSSIFLLHADIFNIKGLVDRIKDAGKNALIHIDFLEGIGKDNRAVDYICEIIKPHGIISTKNNHIRYSIEKGMFTIQRVFLIDSMSYESSVRTAQTIKPDMIEVMPGIMPNILKRISGQLPMPVIAGGLIETKEDIIDVLNSGALAVSTGKKDLWAL